MLVVIVYDISTAEAGGQKRLRKVARLCDDPILQPGDDGKHSDGCRFDGSD